MTYGKAPICMFCKRYRKDADTLVCDAFPGGIPDAILDGEADHRKPYQGDHGKLFLPQDSKAAAYAATSFPTVSFTFNPDEPRDELGQWTDKEGNAQDEFAFPYKVNQLVRHKKRGSVGKVATIWFHKESRLQRIGQWYLRVRWQDTGRMTPIAASSVEAAEPAKFAAQAPDPKREAEARDWHGRWVQGAGVPRKGPQQTAHQQPKDFDVAAAAAGGAITAPPQEKAKPGVKGGSILDYKGAPLDIEWAGAPGMMGVKIDDEWVIPMPPKRKPNPGEVYTDKHGVRFGANRDATAWLQEVPRYDKDNKLIGGIGKKPKVYPKPGEYKDRDQAQEAMSVLFPKVHFNFSRLEIGNINATAKAVVEMAEKYPGPMSSVREISNGKGFDWSTNRTSYAVTVGMGSSFFIYLNPMYYGSKAMLQNIKSDIAIGWHPYNMTDAGAMYRHEFGHVIDFWAKKQPDTVWEKWRDVVNGGNTTMKGFSNYGKTDPKEERAEVFGAMETSPDDSKLAGLANGLGRAMDTALSRIFPNRKPWAYHRGTEDIGIDGLTADERRNLVKELRENNKPKPAEDWKFT